MYYVRTIPVCTVYFESCVSSVKIEDVQCRKLQKPVGGATSFKMMEESTIEPTNKNNMLKRDKRHHTIYS